MSDGMADLQNTIKRRTLQNRDEAIKLYNTYRSKDLVLILIETMKKYSRNEDYTTREYMIILDAIQKVLESRNFIRKTNTWTLEESQNGVPFHSDVIEDEEESD